LFLSKELFFFLHSSHSCSHSPETFKSETRTQAHILFPPTQLVLKRCCADSITVGR